MNRLSGKVAIITGANSGVGAATAKLFANEGAKVIIAARRAQKLAEIADEIAAAGGTAIAVTADVSKQADCEALVAAALENFGKVDILVNNAGVLDEGLKAIDKYEDTVFDHVFSINTKGAMSCIRAALPHLVAQKGGSIVNVDSVSAVNGGGGAVYVASKGAMLSVTKHTAMRGATHNVRCNAICPGSIATPMVANMAPETLDQDIFGPMLAHTDMSLPICMPEDVANTILFLASDESRAITGQVIVHDFGVNL